VLIALGLLVCGAVCQAEIRFTGADGIATVLTSPARRIITLSPHLTELVYAAGAGKQLIATVEFSAYPPQARSITRIGDAFRLDLERIVSLKPDLVIAWSSGNPRQAIQRLESLAVPVWSVEIRRPGEVADVIEAIGNATGNQDSASAAASAYRDRLKTISDRWSTRQAVDYFYQVDQRPLYTINGEHLISHGLTLCGGRNIFSDEPALASQVSLEAVIVANPSALIAPMPPGAADPLAHWNDWQQLRAVQAGGLIRLSADHISRATPRFLEAIEQACESMDDLRMPMETNNE
jgi:iron complex transport system substrate-binding protein